MEGPLAGGKSVQFSESAIKRYWGTVGGDHVGKPHQELKTTKCRKALVKVPTPKKPSSHKKRTPQCQVTNRRRNTE